MSVVDEQSPSPKVAALIRRANQRLASEEGQIALAATVRKTAEMVAQLREAQRVDPKTMLEPITV